MMGLIGFVLVIAGIVAAPPKWRSIISVGLVCLGFILLSADGWRAFQ